METTDTRGAIVERIGARVARNLAAFLADKLVALTEEYHAFRRGNAPRPL